MNTTTGAQRYNKRMDTLHEECRAIENEKKPGPKNRIALRNSTHGVEFRNTSLGRKRAEKFRREHPEFARRRLRYVLQCRPEEVPLGSVYTLT